MALTPPAAAQKVSKSHTDFVSGTDQKTQLITLKLLPMDD